jgi:2-oxoisovalerate dehydrogenase E1 component
MRLALLRSLWRSRLGDLREQSLIRQGKGWFHISGMGHEALAGVALHMEPQDYAFPYYRDRAFCLQRGLTDHDMALAFYAKRDSSSGGRQLTGHFSDRALNIWSHPSPVGAHLLPACGAAWGMQLDGKNSVVYASLGEASARQGDFFEAVCFAKERKLPVIFVVEDNRIAISTSTTCTHPLALGVLNEEEWQRVDGSDVEAVSVAAKKAIKHARAGKGPAFIWCDVERFSNHSSADDQRMYRAAEELEAMHERDPIVVYQRRMIADGLLTEEEAQALEEAIREEIRTAYREAGTTQDPLAGESGLHLTGELSTPETMPALELGDSCRILDAVNKTFHSALDTMPDVVFFGQDIADPKGGVFNLTKGLSKKDPIRAVNSPLAESTIMGVSVGLASYGKRPCFEIQFVDFIYPGWNQLVSNMATLRWRSFGHWKCPLVIYAPCGGYLPGGALWHSQAGEASFARVPGIRVVVPSTPADAAGLFWTALHGEDPTIILLPKHLMWAEQKVKDVTPVPLGQARTIREGSLLTLVTWGNCVELVEESLAAMNAELDTDLDIELIDLRSIQPWDRETITTSILKTGRLLIVQEDNISASVGQMIVAEMCSQHDVLQSLKSPPVIVSKADVHVGFNPIYEYAVLPDCERITAALERLLASTLKTALERDTAPCPESAQSAQTAPAMIAPEDTAPSIKMITVPILGEGIRLARVVSMLKESGEAVKADDPLCEVETDKAVFPIECDEDGVLGEWLISEEDEVEVGQDLIQLTMPCAAKAVKIAPASSAAPAAESIPYEALKRRSGLSQEAVKLLQGIVPATIDMTCRWETVRDARLRSKKTPGGTLSTATMCGWAVLQAMKKHERFASVVRGNELVYDADRFDLGMAVALPGDALETAVVKNADKLEWGEFPDVFNEALRRTRHGAVDSKNRVPLTISSMGAYNVRSAIPIVVPPSLATLFIGAPYLMLDPKSKDGGTMEVASLVLTFDHRWINGVGAAAFLSDVRKGIERFDSSE